MYYAIHGGKSRASPANLFTVGVYFSYPTPRTLTAISWRGPKRIFLPEQLSWRFRVQSTGGGNESQSTHPR